MASDETTQLSRRLRRASDEAAALAQAAGVDPGARPALTDRVTALGQELRRLSLLLRTSTAFNAAQRDEAKFLLSESKLDLLYARFESNVTSLRMSRFLKLRQAYGATSPR